MKTNRTTEEQAMKTYSVRLSSVDVRKIKNIGNGSFSYGIRKLIDEVNKSSDLKALK